MIEFDMGYFRSHFRLHDINRPMNSKYHILLCEKWHVAIRIFRSVCLLVSYNKSFGTLILLEKMRSTVEHLLLS